MIHTRRLLVLVNEPLRSSGLFIQYNNTCSTPLPATVPFTTEATHPIPRARGSPPSCGVLSLFSLPLSKILNNHRSLSAACPSAYITAKTKDHAKCPNHTSTGSSAPGCSPSAVARPRFTLSNRKKPWIPPQTLLFQLNESRLWWRTHEVPMNLFQHSPRGRYWVWYLSAERSKSEGK